MTAPTGARWLDAQHSCLVIAMYILCKRLCRSGYDIKLVMFTLEFRHFVVEHFGEIIVP
jgi:hypothetical protein